MVDSDDSSIHEEVEQELQYDFDKEGDVYDVSEMS